MNAERWRHVEELFERAERLAAGERDDFLRRECAGDPDLAAEVAGMLHAVESRPRLLFPPTEPLVPPRPADPSRAGLPADLGDFQLLEELGRGGMGVVYRARQRSLGRDVALKLLPPSPLLSARQIERFDREARSAAGLRHPCIVDIFAVGTAGDTRYIAMELVRGRDLAQEIERLRKHAGPVPGGLPDTGDDDFVRAVASLIERVADALEYSHEHGVIHRDVKPSNVLLDFEGRVRLVDFGLARDERLGTITAEGELAGTPHYMSPEQVRASLHSVDRRTDVYSLGVVMYELLALHRPFEGRTSQEIIHAIVHQEPPRLRSRNDRVPRDLELVCQTAMARTLADRYATAGLLRDDLRRFLHHQAIRARPIPLGVRARRWLARRRVAVAVGIACLAAVAGIEIGLNERRQQAAREVLASEPLDAGALEGAPMSRLVELRDAARRLRDGFSLRGGDAQRVARLEAGLLGLRAAWVQEAERLRARARDLTLTEGARQWAQLRAGQVLQNAQFLFQDDPEVRALAAAESSLPELSLRALDATGAPAGADVFLREIDLATTGVRPPRRLGRSPLERVPLEPGYYRVVVVFDAGGWRELACNPGLGRMRLDLTARRRADEGEVGRGMVEFAATQFTFPPTRDGLFGSDLVGLSVHLDAFAIDACEVSNADWKRYQAAHPEARTPRRWQHGYTPAHDDLPVVDLDWHDMVAYAEWAGKRLPTAAEWQLAARGHAGRLAPWGDWDPAAPRGNVAHPIEVGSDPAADWEIYTRCAAPVRSFPEACTPEGLYHMLGNVFEMTESMAVTNSGGILTPRQWDRYFFGGAWDALARKTLLDTTSFTGIGPQDTYYRQGFRCARSLQP